MRYFLEVTEAEATELEATYGAKLVSGASGSSANPKFYGPDVAWSLLRTPDADREYRAEVYGETK